MLFSWTTATDGPPTRPARRCGRGSSGRSRSQHGHRIRRTNQYRLRSRDRILVDEAGMVDLQTANVLTELAIEQGVRLALVGDTHQASPVGPAGAMGSAIRHANAARERMIDAYPTLGCRSSRTASYDSVISMRCGL
ncbi:AAA family ATPase [Microbacterium sp. F51-2R]|uniref:AAA family ATPase n=1 Tax=Microbacterium sp. F51-2R TaxID=3445777 RepID=UPI003FA00894